MRVIDVSNPASPAEVGYYVTGGQAREVSVSGNYIYVAAETHGLYVLRSSVPVLSADVTIHPHTLNLASKGRWVNARIELPEPHDAREIDMSSILLNDKVLAAEDPRSNRAVDATDAENDEGNSKKSMSGKGRKKSVTVQFSRRAVAEILPEGEAAEVKVSGWVGDWYFEGVDRIRVIRSGGPLLVEEPLPEISDQFTLHPNYPNPFNPTTTITYSIAKDADVELLIYDVRGTLVRTLVQEHLKSNNYKVRWDGKDNAGNGVSTGVYFYRLKAGTFTSTKKMVLLR